MYVVLISGMFTAATLQFKQSATHGAQITSNERKSGKRRQFRQKEPIVGENDFLQRMPSVCMSNHPKDVLSDSYHVRVGPLM